MELPEIHLDFWTITFLIAGAQACFLAIMILLFRKQKPASNLYLSAFLFFFGYMLIYNFCYWTNYMYHFPLVLFTLVPINYVFGPLLLLYLDSIRTQPRLQKWWWVHFTPFVLFVLHLTPFYILSGELKVEMMTGKTAFVELLFHKNIGILASPRIFSSYLIFYLLWKLYLFRKISQTSTNKGEAFSIRKKWMGLLLILYTCFILSYLTYYIIADQPFFTIAYDYTITAIMTLAIYTMAYMGYRRPYIFSGEIHQKVFGHTKYASSTLTPAVIDGIEQSVLAYMRSHKPYLNNELKLHEVASHLGFSTHQVSQVINERLGKSFNQFINEFRIKEAKELLASPQHQQEAIIQIAYQVGFNNKTTFNHSFKRIVGQTPSQYRNQVLQKSI